MITSVTPEVLKERNFQSIIKEYLINDNGYSESFNKGYDKHHAINVDCLFSFLETTQEKEMEKLKSIYKDSYKTKILNNIVTELRTRGSIDVLKHEIKDYGVKLKLAYFKPPTDLNPEQYELYLKNIISVTEELNYSEGKEIDLVIFLNGIPIITMELKNAYTGQTYKDAIKQYKTDRSNKEQLFRFKERSIVNFAIDSDEAYMCTRLNGGDSVFLPFNKGISNGFDAGAGNPDVKDNLKTSYIWEEVFKKDSLLDIIHKFTYVERKEEILDNGDKKVKERVIFPRYHQLNAVRDILSHVKKNNTGNKYLIQHSAGSGKTNSITWLTHRLASLHDKENNIIFNSVLVVTDRRVLDQQLQDSIYQLEHKTGLVAKIDESSNQLAEEIEKGTKIIISTIQKFPYILGKLSETKEKKYAVVIDEAHSSTSGRAMIALKESMTLEEASKRASEEDDQEIDSEDKINKELEKFVDNHNVSFFAFTATPKGATLRMFGTQRNDGKYYPFHNYSMRQAIEEGFILDVLKNYMTYKMYYNVNKKIDDDPKFDKKKATKEIVKYVSLHPHNISQKTEIIIEHFRAHTMNKIGGEAKAMFVTASRQHAVRYKLSFDAYIKNKGYTDLKTLVAFSSSVKNKDDGLEYTESQMNNGISESKLPKEFDKDESRILIVANKYQTGFDQPRLHTMYVDKKLSGVKAVQTLSRLNRIHPGKEDTFVLDFVNEPEDIKKAFMPFYRKTVLENDIEPNDIYRAETSIYASQLINKDDVMLFTKIFYKNKHTNADRGIMENCVNNTINRTKGLSREELIEFKSLLTRFNNLYNLIIQIAPIADSDLHRLSIYNRFVIKKIDIESPSGVDITDKVLLEYYKLQKQSEGDIDLNSGEVTGVQVRVPDGAKAKDEEKDSLTNIIDRLNQRFGTDFSESEKLAVEQIMNGLKNEEDLKQKAKVNTYDNFKHAFEKYFEDIAVKEYEKNTEFYGRIFQDESFKRKLMDLLMFETYESFKDNEVND